MISLTYLNGSPWFLNIHDAVALLHMKWLVDLQVFWQTATPLLKLTKGWETIRFQGNWDRGNVFWINLQIYVYF